MAKTYLASAEITLSATKARALEIRSLIAAFNPFPVQGIATIVVKPCESPSISALRKALEHSANFSGSANLITPVGAGTTVNPINYCPAIASRSEITFALGKY